MRCPHCNQKNEHNAAFCRSCGNWILGEFYIQPPTAQEVAKKANRKRMYIRLISAAFVLLLLIGMLPFLSRFLPDTTVPGASLQNPVETTPSLPSHASSYLLAESYLTAFSDKNGLTFFMGETAGSSIFEADSKWSGNLQKNAANTVGAYKDTYGRLYCIRREGTRFVAGNVADFVLSYSGDHILYTTMQGEVYLYQYENTRKLINDAPLSKPTSCVISPNGNYAAFLHANTDLTSSSLMLKTYNLMYYDGSKLQTLGTLGYTELISISNDGQTVYALQRPENMLLSISKDGTVTQLGKYEMYLRAPSSSMLYACPTYLNAEHNQLLYYSEDGTYLSTNGGAAQKLSNMALAPVMPAQYEFHMATHSYITFPHKDLLEHVYLESYFPVLDASFVGTKLVQSLCYVDQQGQTQALTFNTKQHWMDPTGRYVYYLTAQNDLQRIDLTNRAYTLTIAQNVKQFAVSFDCSTVSYLTMDNALYRADPQQRQLITTFSNNLTVQPFITNDNVLYYLLEDSFYAVSRDGSDAPVLSGITDYTYAANGALYVTTELGFYISQGSEFQSLIFPALTTLPAGT